MRPGMRLLMMEKARENTRRDGMDRRMGSPDMTTGGYGVESRFRDRRGREHYGNGRFAPMRNEMGYEGPYSGGTGTTSMSTGTNTRPRRRTTAMRCGAVTVATA